MPVKPGLKSLLWQFGLLLSSFLFLWVSCVPREDKVLTEVKYNLKDKTLQRVLQFQDRQNVDSLFNYFAHPDPTYRYAAAMAFGSIKDSAAINRLGGLLIDDVEKVRQAAAYAIGQIGNAKGTASLIRAFQADDSLMVHARTNGTILESVGKTGSQEDLVNLATVTTYRMVDTLLLEGQAWGIYRFALRGITDPSGTATMVKYLANSKYPLSVRIIAANYLYRAKELNLNPHIDAISDAAYQAKDPYIKMTLAIALGKSKTEKGLETLLNLYEREQDYRVKANILRALANFDYTLVAPTVFLALEDRNPHVGRVAADYFLENGVPNDALGYYRLTADSLHWTVKFGLLRAANRHMPAYNEVSKGNLNQQLRTVVLRGTEPYQRAAAMIALAEFPWNYRFIADNGFQNNLPVIRTSSVQALVNILQRPDFNAFFGLSANRVRREIFQYLQNALQSGDSGMVAIAAQGLRIESLDLQNRLSSDSTLLAVRSKLEMPKDLEAVQELNKTIAYYRGEKAKEITPEIKQGINWEVLTSDGLGGKKALIRTSKGNITLEFLPEKAPGTVANFIQLIRRGFYEGKTFHRVVPNFVIQGGCPRGDGYGSLDYTIRSELPLIHYDREGYVGMASAGNHTECTQFFITHSPTPHLDGNYTIFARLSEGMDVVHQMMIGDVIEKIELIDA